MSLNAMWAIPFRMSCVAISKPLLLPYSGLNLAGHQVPTRLLYPSHPQKEGVREERKMEKKSHGLR